MESTTLYNLSSERKVRASEILENYLRVVRMQENCIRSTTQPEDFGILCCDREDGRSGIDLKLLGNTIQLSYLRATMPTGHQLRYDANTAGRGLLELNLESLDAGTYFIYLVYKGWQPVVSVEEYGKTVLPDTIEPVYKLSAAAAIKTILEYPHCLLLGRIKVSSNATTPPKLEENVLPLISQVGAHHRTKTLLEKTKAQTIALFEASERILSQLQFTPDTSIFRDLKMLAAEQRAYLCAEMSRINCWGKHTPFSELYRFWSSVARFFKTWLDSSLVTQRLHSLDLLYRSGARVGQIQMEHYLITSINDLLAYNYDLNDNTNALMLIEQLIAYPILAWLALGDGTPIEGHIKTR